MYTQDFIESLPEDNIKAAALMCEYFWEKEKTNANLIVSRELYENYVTSIFKFKTFCDPYELDYDYPLTNGHPEHDIELIRGFFKTLQEKFEQ